jgi:hypothetical protein
MTPFLIFLYQILHRVSHIFFILGEYYFMICQQQGMNCSVSTGIPIPEHYLPPLLNGKIKVDEYCIVGYNAV